VRLFNSKLAERQAKAGTATASGGRVQLHVGNGQGTGSIVYGGASLQSLGSRSATSFGLAAGSSEIMLTIYQTAWRKIPEGSNLKIPCSDKDQNVRSHLDKIPSLNIPSKNNPVHNTN
jgi:hypothetical protein